MARAKRAAHAQKTAMFDLGTGRDATARTAEGGFHRIPAIDTARLLKQLKT